VFHARTVYAETSLFSYIRGEIGDPFKVFTDPNDFHGYFKRQDAFMHFILYPGAY
jgi:hypothetical protein